MSRRRPGSRRTSGTQQKSPKRSMNAAAPPPVVAIVGRPNVGKSSLVNRILGRREAVVQDIPGVTRDRVSYDACGLVGGSSCRTPADGSRTPRACSSWWPSRRQWRCGPRTRSSSSSMRRRCNAGDEAAARLLRRSGKPVFLAANKVDTERGEADAAELWSLGLGEPMRSARFMAVAWPICRHSHRTLPEVRNDIHQGGPRRVALVGKPNVGKSSLLNRLAGDERSVVHDVAGTTVDPVDSLIEMDGKIWRFIDTAGLRRKVGQASGHEFYASVRTHGAMTPPRSSSC